MGNKVIKSTSESKQFAEDDDYDDYIQVKAFKWDFVWDLLHSMSQLKTITHTGDVSVDQIEKLLDVKQLEFLQVSFNKKYGESVLPIISKMTNLKSIDLTRNNITNVGITPIFEMHNLTELCVNSNELNGAEGLEGFAKMTNLTSLYIGENKIYNEGAKILAKILGEMTQLTSLYANLIHIDSEGIGYICKLTQLKTLDLSENCMDCDSAELLSKSLTQLTFLKVSRSDIRSNGVKFLSSLPLTHLDLSYNHIDDEGLSALLQMKYLEKLNLQSNEITLKEIKSFPNMMSRLTSLNLESNRIEDDQVSILGEFKQLKVLNIKQNLIDVKGALILSEFKHLTSLEYWRDNMSEEAKQIFKEMKRL